MVIRSRDKISTTYNNRPLIIMLPYAGGNTYSYKSISNYLCNRYNILCPELPGRGELCEMDLIDDFNSLISYLMNEWITPILTNNRNIKYLFYGHSMGALLSYYLTHEIRNRNYVLPLKLIVSGREGPSFKDEKEIHTLTSNLFWEELYSMGGITSEILENENIKEYFEPIIRSDIKAIENLKYTKLNKLTIPITAIYGDKENINLEGLYSWRNETICNVNFKSLPGDHFFINEHYEEISKIIISTF